MDVDSSSKSGASSMVPLGLGLLGLVLGAIALFMSVNNSSKITALNALSDDVAAAKTAAEAAKATADGLSSKVDATVNNLTALHSAVQDNLTQIVNKINQHATDIAALQANASRGGSRTSSGGTAEASKVVPGQGGTHIVASGDTFSKIAKQYGVSLADLEAANPGVDSSKLRLNQHITIPPSHSSGTSSRPAPSTSAPTSSAPATGASGPAPAVAP